MLKTTAEMVLPTALVGSIPRPSWYTASLGSRSFVDAMVNAPYREQYTDALGAYLREQEMAGLDIVTDGDCRFDDDVGGPQGCPEGEPEQEGEYGLDGFCFHGYAPFCRLFLFQKALLKISRVVGRIEGKGSS